MVKQHIFAWTLAGLAWVVAIAPAADWPQWRGPDRNEVSRDKDLLESWPKDGPPMLWTYKNLGIGYSGMAVVGDRLITQFADDKEEYITSIDLKTQKPLWKTAIGTRFRNEPWGDGPRGTPTVDGAFTYGIGGQGNLFCVKTDTGEVVWSKRLREDLNGEMMSGWGYTESPLVDGDLVVATPGGKKGAIAALDKKTGELKWRSQGFTDKAAYSSLIKSEIGEIPQYIQMTGESVASVSAKDGSLLWKFARKGSTAAIPTPVASKNYVYATSGYGAGCTLIEIKPGTEAKADQVYANKDMVNHHGGVVLVGDHIYGYSDTKGWICQDFKTGEVAWASKKLGKGSCIYADGHLILYSEDNGTCVLIEANPKQWKETGRFTIPMKSDLRSRNGKVWTHPTIANGKLYLRDQQNLFCYDISKTK